MEGGTKRRNLVKKLVKYEGSGIVIVFRPVMKRVIISVGGALTFALVFASILEPVVQGQGQKVDGGSDDLWAWAGHDLYNTRNASTETTINAANAGALEVKWVVETRGGVSATPAVDGVSVYFPDWGGSLFSIDRRTGATYWERRIEEYTGLPPAAGGVSRTTPAVHDDSLILGDQAGLAFGAFGASVGSVFSISQNTGDLNWITTVGDHPATIITQSPVVYEDTVYVGVASVEESFAAFVPGYPCCTFRGSVVALNLHTGDIEWQTFMTPPPPVGGDSSFPGFSGNAVWGNTAVVDDARRVLYVTTGNNYSAPDGVIACVAAASTPEAVKACVDVVPGNYFDSVVALDLKTGEVRWTFKAEPYDTSTISCVADVFPDAPIIPDSCPTPAGPDYDFGQGPMLFTIRDRPGSPFQLLGAGNKSGAFWALRPYTGAVEWVNEGLGGSFIGGLQWGSATDEQRIYTANTFGGWSALDPVTGETLWTTPQPGPAGVLTFGPVTVANGVLFGGSNAPGPLDENMFAMDAKTGALLFRFASGGSVGSGPAVVDGTVYWGSGYPTLNGSIGTDNTKLYAFEVPHWR